MAMTADTVLVVKLLSLKQSTPLDLSVVLDKIRSSRKSHLKLPHPPHPPKKKVWLSFAILVIRQVLTKFIKADGRPSEIVRLFTNLLNCSGWLECIKYKVISFPAFWLHWAKSIAKRDKEGQACHNNCKPNIFE